MELWDLYDAERKLLGRDHVRGETIPEGCYHLVVHAWIRNSKGEYLISQRAASRKSFPLMWECVGGSALKGEDSRTAAVREIKEEVGVDAAPEDGQRLFSQLREQYRGERYADILDVWLWQYDGPVDLSAATTDEVAQTRWMTIDQIRELCETGKLVDSLEYILHI